MPSGSPVFMENVVGLLARLKWLEDRITASGLPLPHAGTHETTIGTDLVDVTLLGGFPGGTTTFLRDDGTFAVPAGTGINQLTGDVTAGPGSGAQVATIANNAVTFAKFQDISTDRLLGRDTAGSGDVEEISVGGGLAFTGAGAIGITANGVDNTMLADMATQTFKGRNTAGVGDPEDLSVATAQTMLSITTELQLVKMRITAAARM